MALDINFNRVAAAGLALVVTEVEEGCGGGGGAMTWSVYEYG